MFRLISYWFMGSIVWVMITHFKYRQKMNRSIMKLVENEDTTSESEMCFLWKKRLKNALISVTASVVAMIIYFSVAG